MLRQLLRPLRLGPARPFRLIQVESALRCNLRCVMCPWTELRDDDGMMAVETFKELVKAFPLARGVDLTGGGEPLLHPELVNMVRAAAVHDCEVGFSTNGTFLDRSLAADLVDAGTGWISFSIDASTAATYERIRQGASFRQVVDNIAGLNELKHALKAHALRTMFVFVMMRENYTELPGLIDLAQELGVRQVIAKNLDVILKDGDDERRVFTHGEEGSPEVAEALAEARRRSIHCGVQLRVYSQQPSEVALCDASPVDSLFVSWDGYVSPCITLSYASDRFFAGERRQTACHRFGNVLQEPLEEIWENPEYREFRHHYHQRLTWDRRNAMRALLDGRPGTNDLPPAPAECTTCYYLYGV